jgi:hypothetical protein
MVGTTKTMTKNSVRLLNSITCEEEEEEVDTTNRIIHTVITITCTTLMRKTLTRLHHIKLADKDAGILISSPTKTTRVRIRSRSTIPTISANNCTNIIHTLIIMHLTTRAEDTREEEAEEGGVEEEEEEVAGLRVAMGAKDITPTPLTGMWMVLTSDPEDTDGE